MTIYINVVSKQPSNGLSFIMLFSIDLAERSYNQKTLLNISLQDGDGAISAKELGAVLRSLGINVRSAF